MKVGASLSCSGTARGEGVSIPIPGRCANAMSTQMVLAGPGHLLHYRQSRLGRTGQRFVNISQKNVYSSRKGRRGVLKTVSSLVRGLHNIFKQNAFSLPHTLTFQRKVVLTSSGMLLVPRGIFPPDYLTVLCMPTLSKATQALCLHCPKLTAHPFKFCHAATDCISPCSGGWHLREVHGKGHQSRDACPELCSENGSL